MSMSSSTAVNSCLHILQRTPPLDTEKNVEGLSSLLSPQDKTELSQRLVHVVPLKVATDPKAENRPFLVSAYNRNSVQSSYRSPWSNTFYEYPSLKEDSTSAGPALPQEVRTLEQHANEVWSVYTEMYYGKKAVGSVYLWNEEEVVMSGCFLVHSSHGDDGEDVSEWNSCHVVHVTPERQASSAKYSIQSTAWVALRSKESNSNTVVSGLLHKTVSKVLPCDASTPTIHVENIGRLIETVESELRSGIHSVCLPKTLEVVESMYTPVAGAGDVASKPARKKKPMGIPMMGGGAPDGHAAMLNQAILARKLKKTNL